MGDDVSWHLSPGPLILEDLPEDEAVVAYTDLSGTTHILHILAATVLDCLRDAPASRDDLRTAVPGRLGLSLQECPARLVDTTLDDLDHAGLVQPMLPLQSIAAGTTE